MAYDQIHIVDAASQMIEVSLRSSTTGQLLTGKAYGDMTIKYQREGAAAATTVSVVTATKGAYTSGGFVETDIAGLYQFGIPNGALATGAKAVTLTFVCSGALDVVKRIVLVGADLRNVTTLGLANLDAAVSTRSTYAGGDTSGVTTLLSRIIGTLATGTHNPQSGDAFARLGAPAGVSVSADIANVPTVSEFEARTLVAASYFDPATDIVSNVDTVLSEVLVGEIALDQLNAIADAVLKRDWTGVSGEASRSLLNALRFLRNKWSVSGSTLTVTKEDDATTAWTATLSTDAAADPVTGSDPA